MQRDLAEARAAGIDSRDRGDTAEKGFKEFLRQYLPKTLEISRGHIIDSNGNISRELDIIISDAMQTPILY